MVNYTIAQGQTKDEIRDTSATVNIDNAGLIWGHGPNGVLREAIWLSGVTTASLLNRSSGVIEGTNAHAAVIFAQSATINNAGTIRALTDGKRGIQMALNSASDLTAITNSGRISGGANGDAIVLTNSGAGRLKILNSGQIDGGIEAQRLDNSGTITRLGAADLSISSTLKNTGTITTAQINGTAAITNSGSITADAISAATLNNNSATAVITATISTSFDTVISAGTVNGGALMTVKNVIDNQGDLSAGRINTVSGNDALDLTLGLADGRGVTNVGEMVAGMLDTHELMNFGTVTLNYAGGNNVPSAASGFFATQLSDILVISNFGTITADVIHGDSLYNRGTLTLAEATMGAGVGVATEFQSVENTGEIAGDPNGIINGSFTADEVYNLGIINGTVTLNDINGDGTTDYNGNGSYDGAVIVGSSGTDKVMGTYGGDSIKGGGGNDRLDGNHGNDTIYGEGGNDTLNGSTGNDFLDGGSGSDKIYFNPMGNMTAKGGSGTDQFHFMLAGMTTGDCTITDFANGSEKIRIYVNDQTNWDTWAELRSIMVQTDPDTVTIDFERAGGLGSLAIDGVTLAQMDSSDFVFI